MWSDLATARAITLKLLASLGMDEWPPVMLTFSRSVNSPFSPTPILHWQKTSKITPYRYKRYNDLKPEGEQSRMKKNEDSDEPTQNNLSTSWSMSFEITYRHPRDLTLSQGQERCARICWLMKVVGPKMFRQPAGFFWSDQFMNSQAKHRFCWARLPLATARTSSTVLCLNYSEHRNDFWTWFTDVSWIHQRVAHKHCRLTKLLGQEQQHPSPPPCPHQVWSQSEDRGSAGAWLFHQHRLVLLSVQEDDSNTQSHWIRESWNHASNMEQYRQEFMYWSTEVHWQYKCYFSDMLHLSHNVKLYCQCSHIILQVSVAFETLTNAVMFLLEVVTLQHIISRWHGGVLI